MLDIAIVSAVALALIGLFSTELTGRLPSLLDVSAVNYTSGLFNNVYLYGVFFYNNWYLPFLVAAVVLLVAMLGSIILTTRLAVVESTKSRFSVIWITIGALLVVACAHLTSSDTDGVLCEGFQVTDPSVP